MGQCLSSSAGLGTPEHFKGRWAQQGGLADGLAAFDAAHKYGGTHEVPAPAPFSTTADVGLKARDENKFVFLHENKPPAPLQLERIDEDVTLQGASDASPLKPAALAMPAPEAQRLQRKPINWTRGELVGQGAFGSVFVAMDNDTGELIAVKQVHIPRGGGAHAKKVEENIRSVEEEVQLLQQFDHANIVRYLGTEKTEESLNIFLEYVPGGSIASLLAKFGSFKESVVKVYTKQILMGLEYLHSKGIMHRDIKGANILVDNTGLVKLADFGASKKLEDLVTVADGNKSVKGTPYWMAPEVITQTGHGRQADLWSVACTVLEMATGRPPWSKDYPSQVAAMFHIASSKGPPEIPQHLSPECKDFLYLCFNRDWKARPLASTLLHHPFLADVTVRSHAGPSPSATAMMQAWNVPRSVSSAAAAESDGQFGTPSPLNPKLAAAKPGIAPGNARISLQTATDGAPGDSAAELSPLGHHAVSRQKQWADAPASQQPAQQQQTALAPVQAPLTAHREPSMGHAASRLTSSPVKRPGMSLRASAPVFSGYASVALSQQSEQLAPLSRLAPAPTLQRQPSSNLRSSRESTSGSGAPASDTDTAGQGQSQQGELCRSGSGLQVEQEASPAARAVPAADAEAVPVQQGAAEHTPVVQRQRPALLIPGESDKAAPPSASTSSGTNKSDYNPMEEPSWLHSLESPLEGDGTPTSALTAAAAAGGASPEQRGVNGGELRSSREASSYPAAAPRAVVLPPGEAVDAMPRQQAEAGQAAPAAPYVERPSADHMVWTNEDGDIDALPWDMGGWSTGSSGQQEQQQPPPRGELGAQRGQQQAAAAAKVPAEPVDEDALIGALRRKAQHDVRASLALFERSLNIPALHGPPSPKSGGSGAVCSTTHTITAVKPAPLVLPPPVAELMQGAESIEGRGVVPGSGGSSCGGGSRVERRQSFPLQPPAPLAAVDAAPGSRRSTDKVQQLLAAVRETASGAPLPAAPLAAAVGGLAGLGYGGSTAADRESIWQQELSQELFRVKSTAAGGGGGVPNRRVSMHGSPIKRPGSIHQ